MSGTSGDEQRALRESVERIAYENPDLDATLREADNMQAMSAGLPVTFRDQEGKQSLRGRDATIVQPNQSDIQNYAQAPSRTCGTCKFFMLTEGRKKMVEERFIEKLVVDYGWQAKHLGAPVDQIAVCGASGGELAVTTVSNAGNCDQYRPRNRGGRQR